MPSGFQRACKKNEGPSLNFDQPPILAPPPLCRLMGMDLRLALNPAGCTPLCRLTGMDLRLALHPAGCRPLCQEIHQSSPYRWKIRPMPSIPGNVVYTITWPSLCRPTSHGSPRSRRARTWCSTCCKSCCGVSGRSGCCCSVRGDGPPLGAPPSLCDNAPPMRPATNAKNTLIPVDTARGVVGMLARAPSALA